jgi:hypothetical protein
MYAPPIDLAIFLLSCAALCWVGYRALTSERRQFSLSFMPIATIALAAFIAIFVDVTD